MTPFHARRRVSPLASLSPVHASSPHTLLLCPCPSLRHLSALLATPLCELQLFPDPRVLSPHHPRYALVRLCPDASCSRRRCSGAGTHRHPPPSATVPCPPPPVNCWHCPSARVCDAAPVVAATISVFTIVWGACQAAADGSGCDSKNAFPPLLPGFCGNGPEPEEYGWPSWRRGRFGTCGRSPE